MAKTKNSPKPLYLVHYVDDSTPKLKKFASEKAAQAFVKKFQKENPLPQDGFWVDYLISDIRGEVKLFNDYWTA